MKRFMGPLAAIALLAGCNDRVTDENRMNVRLANDLSYIRGHPTPSEPPRKIAEGPYAREVMFTTDHDTITFYRMRDGRQVIEIYFDDRGTMSSGSLWMENGICKDIVIDNAPKVQVDCRSVPDENWRRYFNKMIIAANKTGPYI